MANEIKAAREHLNRVKNLILGTPSHLDEEITIPWLEKNKDKTADAWMLMSLPQRTDDDIALAKITMSMVDQINF